MMRTRYFCGHFILFSMRLVMSAATWSAADEEQGHVVDTVVAASESQIQMYTNEGMVDLLRVMPNTTFRNHGLSTSSSTVRAAIASSSKY